MVARALRARAGVTLVLLAAATGCATPTDATDDPPPEPEEILPLELSVDGVDISHGALRLTATMVDGAADVSVTLGDACERREVGGGVSTLSTLVWTLGEGELADALACDLVVRARVRTGRGHVTKEVLVSLTPEILSSPDNTEQAPQAGEGETSLDGVTIVFTPGVPGARLSAGDSIVEPEPVEEDAPDDTTRRFVVPRRDFARSVLLRWPLRMEGASFDTSVVVGGVELTTDDGDVGEIEEEIEDDVN
jgi:hypothetical protein